MVQNLLSTSISSNSITLSWDELSCVDHNGEITGYRIEYGVATFDTMEAVTGSSFTANGLRPFSNYTFRVAAIGNTLIGQYSAALNRQTSLSSGTHLIQCFRHIISAVQFYHTFRGSFVAPWINPLQQQSCGH